MSAKDGLSLDVKGSENEYDWDVTFDPDGLFPNGSSFRPVFYAPASFDLCADPDDIQPQLHDDDTWWWSTPDLTLRQQGAGEKVAGHVTDKSKCMFYTLGPVDTIVQRCEADHCGDPTPTECPCTVVKAPSSLSLTSHCSHGSDDLTPTEYFSLETNYFHDQPEVKGVSGGSEELEWNTICNICHETENECCRELSKLRLLLPSVEPESRLLNEGEGDANDQTDSVTEYELTRESLQKLNDLIDTTYCEDDQSIISELDEIMDEIVELVDRGTSPVPFWFHHKATSTASLLPDVADVGIQKSVESEEVGVQTELLRDPVSPERSNRVDFKVSPGVKGQPGPSRIPRLQPIDRLPSFIPRSTKFPRTPPSPGGRKN